MKVDLRDGILNPILAQDLNTGETFVALNSQGATLYTAMTVRPSATAIDVYAIPVNTEEHSVQVSFIPKATVFVFVSIKPPFNPQRLDFFKAVGAYCDNLRDIAAHPDAPKKDVKAAHEKLRRMGDLFNEQAFEVTKNNWKND